MQHPFPARVCFCVCGQCAVDTQRSSPPTRPVGHTSRPRPRGDLWASVLGQAPCPDAVLHLHQHGTCELLVRVAGRGPCFTCVTHTRDSHFDSGVYASCTEISSTSGDTCRPASFTAGCSAELQGLICGEDSGRG